MYGGCLLCPLYPLLMDDILLAGKQFNLKRTEVERTEKFKNSFLPFLLKRDMRKGFVSAQYFFLCGAPRLDNFLVQVNAVYCNRRSPPFSLLLRNPATTRGKWSHYNPYFERLQIFLSRNWISRPIERTLNLSEAGYRKRKVWVGKRPKRWCYAERFATTIFNAAQRCKAETML